VDALEDENQRLAFVRAFRELARLKNVLTVFAEFDWSHLDLDNQTFDEFKSKYLDIHDLTRKESEEGTVSIVNDVDFELELIRQDKINVAYILQLLRDLKDEDKRADMSAPVDHEKRLADILDMVASEAQLRSKRELIEKFIQQNIAQLAPGDDVSTLFKAYWDEEKEAAFAAFCAQEGLDRERFDKLVDQFNFNGQPPLRDDVVATLVERPKILERRKIVDRIIDKMRSLVRTFEDDVGEI
jgi:type I restriction enzyme, R subunit